MFSDRSRSAALGHFTGDRLSAKRRARVAISRPDDPANLAAWPRFLVTLGREVALNPLRQYVPKLKGHSRKSE